MEDKKEFQSILKIVKLITSSLFARKQPFMIVDGRTPDTFYYTNIDRERVALYRPTMEDVLSKVKITDTKVTDALHKAFPAFKDMIAQIDLVAFSTNLNKSLKYSKTSFPRIKVDEKSRMITMEIDPDPENKEDHLVADAPIGTLMTDLDTGFYEDIIKNYEKFSDTVVKRSFRGTSVDGDDKVTLEIIEVSGKDDVKNEFALPLKDGFSMVSMKEYVNKRAQDPLYELLLRMSPTARTAKAEILYRDDWLDAMTIMPASLWFM